MDPQSPLVLWTVAIIEAWSGNDSEAIDTFDRLAEIAPGWIYTQHGLFQKHAMLGEKELALQHYLPEMADEARYDCHFALHLAECFSLIGDLDRSLTYLDVAVSNGLLNTDFLCRHDRLLENVRSDKRFERLISTTAKTVADIRLV
jgi:hypothetical protein